MTNELLNTFKKLLEMKKKIMKMIPSASNNQTMEELENFNKSINDVLLCILREIITTL